MIGNDIVDLSISTIGDGTRRERYLSKTCTASEIEIIHSSVDQNLMFWMVWSMKESVHKIVSRNVKPRYAPKEFEVLEIGSVSSEEYHSIIRHKHKLFHGTTSVLHGCIHTICTEVETNFDSFDSEVFILEGGQSSQEVIHSKIASHYDATDYEIEVKRNQYGAPFIDVNGEKINQLSIAHHGRFAGYAVQL